MLTIGRGLTIALTALLGAAGAGQAQAAEGSGLRAYVEDTVWPRWQARVLSNASFSLWRHAATEAAQRRPYESMSVLGDYYFARGTLGPQRSGGFRATSGLIFGNVSSQAIGGLELDPRSHYLGSIAGDPYDNRPFAPRLDSAPYLGIGYTSLTAGSGWGFTADIGLAARTGSTGQLGRSLGSAQSLDDTLREMRLTPLVNVGVSYSF